MEDRNLKSILPIEQLPELDSVGILAALITDVMRVTLPGKGVTYFRHLSGAERVAWLRYIDTITDKQESHRSYCYLVCLGLSDKNGNRILKDEDRETLYNDRDPIVIAELAEEILRWNGMARDEETAEEGPAAENDSDDSQDLDPGSAKKNDQVCLDDVSETPEPTAVP